MRLSALFAVLALAVVPCLAQETKPAPDAKDAATAPEAKRPVMPPDVNSPEPAADKLKTIVKKNEQGVVIMEYTAYIDEKGQEIKHGKFAQYYDNGKKRREAVYKFNRTDGQETWWHVNGKVWMQFTTKMNVRDGAYVEYSFDGRPKVQRKYKDGQIVE